MGDVKLLSRWDGWCDPCGTERPLLLTAKGEFGPRAWLSGVGMEDRTLVLTCGVCGEWQLCPWDEEFPPESVVVELSPVTAEAPEPAPATPKRRTAPVQHIILQTAFGPARPTTVPALHVPRSATPHDSDASLRLLVEERELVAAAGR